MSADRHDCHDHSPSTHICISGFYLSLLPHLLCLHILQATEPGCIKNQKNYRNMGGKTREGLKNKSSKRGDRLWSNLCVFKYRALQDMFSLFVVSTSVSCVITINFDDTSSVIFYYRRCPRFLFWNLSAAFPFRSGWFDAGRRQPMIADSTRILTPLTWA